jgi:small subunit ribosomal protein S3
MVMARRISGSIERGINPRRVINFALEKIMQAGARGAEIIIAGKLIGKGGKAKKERISAGYLKKAGDMTKLVRVAQAQALKKAGTIGITVKIIPPDVVFPDKVDITKAVFTEEKKKEGGEASGNTETRQDTRDEQRGEAPAATAAAQ